MNPIWWKLKCLRFESCTWTISSIIVTTVESSSFWITHSITKFWICNITYFFWNSKEFQNISLLNFFILTRNFDGPSGLKLLPSGMTNPCWFICYCWTLPVKGLSCQDWIACVSIFTNTLNTVKSFNSHTANSSIIIAFNYICVIITVAISNYSQSIAIYQKAKSL